MAERFLKAAVGNEALGAVATVETVLGPIHVASVADAIVQSSMPGEARSDFEAQLAERFPAIAFRDAADEPVLRQAAAQLREYAAGRRRRFDLPLAPGGTKFQDRVWKALQEIPYGAVQSYGDVAYSVGKPLASRAVGQANNRNPLPLIIPCHRVIGADGSLGGYGGGLEMKQRLLEHEGVRLPE